MPDEISQDGIGNIAFQSVENSTVNITQQLGKSVQYQELLNQLNTLNELHSYVPENELEKRIAVSKQINDLESFIENFKQDVLRLAETFNRIEIDTKRLIQAKEFFDNGEFDKSRAILKSQIEQIKDEQIRLLKKREDYEHEVAAKLKHNSEEFLILALSMAFDFKNLNRFQDTCNYFENSIKSYETQYNLFLFANFWASHNKFPEAKKYWEKCLENFQREMTTGQEVEILNNIALTYSYLDEFESAESRFKKALLLARQLEEREPSKQHKSSIAYVLNNFGLLLTNFVKNDEAEANLFESLEIRRNLVFEDSFEALNNVGVTFLNLGLTFRNKEDYKKAEEYYIEALKIYDELVEKRPFQVFQQIALIKNNLGDIYWKTNLIELAEENFNHSLEINTILLNIEPLMIIPQTVIVLSNLALFHQAQTENQEDSVRYAYDALFLAMPFIDGIATLYGEFMKSRDVLLRWGLSDEHIESELMKMSNSYSET